MIVIRKAMVSLFKYWGYARLALEGSRVGHDPVIGSEGNIPVRWKINTLW